MTAQYVIKREKLKGYRKVLMAWVTLIYHPLTSDVTFNRPFDFSTNAIQVSSFEALDDGMESSWNKRWSLMDV